MVVLPVQAGAWVSDLVLSVPAQCLLGRSSFSGKPTVDILLHCLLRKDMQMQPEGKGGLSPFCKVSYMQMAYPWHSEKAAQEAFLLLVRPDEGLLKVSLEAC